MESIIIQSFVCFFFSYSSISRGTAWYLVISFVAGDVSVVKFLPGAHEVSHTTIIIIIKERKKEKQTHMPFLVPQEPKWFPRFCIPDRLKMNEPRSFRVTSNGSQ